LEAVTGLLSEDVSVTALPCGLRGGYVVEAVVRKGSVNLLIPALKAAGAAHVLEIPIAKIVD
jgi:ATP phosphoribosyltransferase